MLRGDLIVRGNGDPTINTRDGRADAGARRVGARRSRPPASRAIDGRIIGDDQAFDDEGIGAGWAWDYLQYGYAAPVGALQFNENVATLTVAPGAAAGDPVIVRLDARQRSRGAQPRRRPGPRARTTRSTTAATSIGRCSR